MGRTIAITGVNSYFASTLLPKLQNNPEIDEIRGIDVTPWRGGYNKVKFFREDIRSEKISEILEGVDTVFHLAFIVGEIQDKAETFNINIDGSKNVFKACVKNKVRKVIYTSSNTVYGAYKEIPLYVTEDQPLHKNEESYYNKSKVEVETFATDFFASHPEIIFTVIRAALLFGPNTQNMFAEFYKLKVTAMPVGTVSHIHYIHEEDLGEALHIAGAKDLQGIYNVGADDAISSVWSFNEAGVKIIPVPLFLLKPLANFAFKLGLLPASSGWVILASNTIFSSNRKFKNATGWSPQYTSAETFKSFLDAKERPKNKKFTQSIVAFLLKYRSMVKMILKGTNTGFKIGKIPGLRTIFPWTDPNKNSITYLPVNEHVDFQNEQILPQTVHNLIEKSKAIVILDRCACRYGEKCQNHPTDIGCMFLGESALSMPESIRREANKEEAHAHVERAIGAGLVPMTGKVRFDNDAFLIPDKKKLAAVCFCCHCCCMMRYYKHMPSDQLNEVMPRVEGFHLEVTDACVGCGECIEYCGWDAIKLENNRAVHSDKCRGCGRCAVHCPEKAIKITINNPDAVQDVEKRVLSYVDIQN